MVRRDQDVAAAAWAIVGAVPDGERREFRSRALGLAPMLQGSGLAATAAFLRAKSATTLAEALECHVLGALDVTLDDQTTFISWLGRVGSSDYRRAGAAAREFATWVKRAAEALIAPAVGG